MISYEEKLKAVKLIKSELSNIVIIKEENETKPEMHLSKYHTEYFEEYDLKPIVSCLVGKNDGQNKTSFMKEELKVENVDCYDDYLKPTTDSKTLQEGTIADLMDVAEETNNLPLDSSNLILNLKSSTPTKENYKDNDLRKLTTTLANMTEKLGKKLKLKSREDHLPNQKEYDLNKYYRLEARNDRTRNSRFKSKTGKREKFSNHISSVNLRIKGRILKGSKKLTNM